MNLTRKRWNHVAELVTLHLKRRRILDIRLKIHDLFAEHRRMLEVRVWCSHRCRFKFWEHAIISSGDILLLFPAACTLESPLGWPSLHDVCRLKLQVLIRKLHKAVCVVSGRLVYGRYIRLVFPRRGHDVHFLTNIFLDQLIQIFVTLGHFCPILLWNNILL